ncbi:VOC family protein [Bradyrhizobium commune]|uniref:VOC family protein n=1 Tax=Bradyrhizobium commune TaxID=83627 RepID=A0A7S9H0U1_9BRAD|nr:VOC family protein [Bradyrhizobium commune]QPF92969.1 VOC family protein [Bradyrhizobium commune]
MIRYKKLGYVELNVSNLDRSRRFYEDVVGLEFVGERSDGAVLFRCDDEDPRSVVLHQQQPAGFKSVGWQLEDEAQFELLHRRLRDARVPYEELGSAQCELRQAIRVTRTTEPHSHAALEFFTADGPRPDKPFAVTHTKIQRLGHVVWSVPHEVESIAFFREVLNFRESDSIGEIMTFMRPFPSPFHHGIGVGKGPKRVIHHLNFMVSEIDDIGKAQNRMRKHDVPIVFGPGRHPASTSVFFYFLEPDGMTLEYSFGMEEFTEVDPRKPRTLPMAAESIDEWGSVRDPRMGQTGDIEEARIGAPA